MGQFKVTIAFQDQTVAEILNVTGINYTDSWVQITHEEDGQTKTTSLNKDIVLSVIESFM